jgi:peptidyl-prolyl cis-trans isomerase C
LLRTLILALLAGCTPEPPPPPPPPPVPGVIEVVGETAFTVNGIAVSEQMVEAGLAQMPPDQVAQMRATGQIEQFQEHLALTEILYGEAVREELHNDEKVKLGLAISARQYLSQAHLERVGRKAITDEAVNDYYELRKVQYVRPSIHARHILVDKYNVATDLAVKLRGGGDFAQLSHENSKDPGSKDRGGDLGWFTADQMIDKFSEVAFNLEPGTVSDPVETQFGYHLIEVLEKREATPLEEVRPEIEQKLMEQSVQRYVVELRSKLDIKKGGE